jgi:hypothetical protein
MKASGKFTEAMRRQANAGVAWTYLKWGVADLLLAAWGFYRVIAPGDDSGPAEGLLLGGAMLIGAASGAFFIVRGIKKRRSPPGHPLDMQLAAYGDPTRVAEDIDADFATESFKARRIQVGRRWLCYAGKGQATIRKLDQLTWVYTERIRHRYNMIPYRPASHQLLIWDRNGIGAAIPVRKRAAPSAIALVKQHAPWVFTGYSETLKESWNADRPEFIALIDARRREALSARQ